MRKIKMEIRTRRTDGEEAPFFIRITITPEIAAKILEISAEAFKNRKPKKATVERYAQMMRNGQWSATNGETIKMDDDGILKDGSHRLNAVVVAGIPIEFILAWGIEPDAELTIDTGTSRTPGDLLHMREFSNANATAALLNVIRQYKSGSVNNPTTKLDGHMMAEIMKDLEDEYRINADEISIIAGSSRPVSKRLRCTPATAAAAIMLLRYDGNPEISNIFFEGIIEQAEIPRGDARLPLLNTDCVREAGINGTGPLRSLNQLGVIIKAWNNYIQCKSVTNKYKAPTEMPKIIRYNGPFFTPRPGSTPPR